MDIVYRVGSATAVEIHESIPDAPSYSAIRALLVVLEEKGYLKHSKAGRRYLYEPTVAPARARRSAVRRVLQTFYENSPANLLASLLDAKDVKLSPAELDRMREIVNNHAPPGDGAPKDD